MNNKNHPQRCWKSGFNKLSFALCGLLIIGSASFLASANAALYLEEGFDYEPGVLAGNPGWINNASQITVADLSLSYPGLEDVTPTGNAGRLVSNTSSASAVYSYRTFDTMATSGNVYVSAVLRFTGHGANVTIMGMLPSAVTVPGVAANDPADLAYFPVTPGVSADGFRLGIRAKGQSAVVAGPTLFLNNDFLLVMKYDMVAKSASFFVNPDLNAGEPLLPHGISTSTATAVADINGFFLRAAANTSTTSAFLIDNLRAGPTWADVTPVPEPTTVGLMAVGAACLFFKLRRSRS